MLVLDDLKKLAIANDFAVIAETELTTQKLPNKFYVKTKNGWTKQLFMHYKPLAYMFWITECYHEHPDECYHEHPDEYETPEPSHYFSVDIRGHYYSGQKLIEMCFDHEIFHQRDAEYDSWHKKIVPCVSCQIQIPNKFHVHVTGRENLGKSFQPNQSIEFQLNIEENDRHNDPQSAESYMELLLKVLDQCKPFMVKQFHKETQMSERFMPTQFNNASNEYASQFDWRYFKQLMAK